MNIRTDEKGRAPERPFFVWGPQPAWLPCAPRTLDDPTSSDNTGIDNPVQFAMLSIKNSKIETVTGRAMRDLGVVSTRSATCSTWPCAVRAWHPAAAIWSFVYVFFTNGIPFDAPNRSEPCRLS